MSDPYVFDPEAPDPVAALREIAFWRERARVDSHRVMAYRNAADAVEGLPAQRREALGTSAAAWQRLSGIGSSTATAITQALAGTVPTALVSARASSTEVLAVDDDAGRAFAARLRGDLHSHTEASDGSTPAGEMARVARRLGRSYLAVTDHSPRLTVARGLSPARLRAQLDEIAALNEALVAEHEASDGEGEPFRVLTGIEVDILPDGSLDQESELLGRLDVVVASVHSELRMESAAMTRRLVTAVANPHVDVLGHCTGRKVEGKPRPPSTFDAEIVFEACRELGTAVEINSRPERRDPPHELIALAVETGCLFSIDSDSHAPGQLSWLPLAASRAARAGVDPDDVITTWPVERLLEWTTSHG
ncbi:MAG TPA: PHP domain-containing protein [Micrococcales bacterium]|uniref:PHP domain-containing protein n=1 Tax=Miniimonas arenae TaxID=676201 RepID=UPI000EBCEA81|nr:PHP domain-containing protein [Miniimonas arenae]HCX85475.1 PHP domain-containing protein [Micrococcales bacterium]